MFVYWILYPLLFAATLVGLGLGVRRIGGVPFSAALLMPIGYCASVVIAAFFVAFNWTVNFAGPALLILGFLGWLVSYRELRAAAQNGAWRRAMPWILAGLAGFLWFGASAITALRPTFTGYNQIVDIASQLNWVQYLADHGRDPITQVLGSSDAHIAGTQPTGYPAGPQAVLGVFPKVFGMDVTWAWQPYLSFAAAMIVLGAYGLLTTVTDSRRFAALGAFAAGQASCLIGYGLIGGIKEMTAVATILPTVALITTATNADRPFWRAVIPFSVAMAGAYSVFSLTLLPWLGIFGAGAALLVWQAFNFKEAVLRSGTALFYMVVTTLVTTLPSMHSGSFADRMKTDVGNLATVPTRWMMSGFLFTDDHRFDVTGGRMTFTIIVSVIIFLLALVGIWSAFKKRQWPLIILVVATLVGMKLIMLQFGNWMDLKALCLTAPVSLLMAAVGLSAIREAEKKPIVIGSWVGVSALVIAGLWVGAMRFGVQSLAPTDRFAEFKSYDQRWAGMQRSLFPDWDENAGFQMRHAHLSQAFANPYPGTPEWEADPAKPTGDPYEWDFDHLQQWWLQQYGLIVMRRAPGQSRPPGQFEQVAQGQYFTVFQQLGKPAAGQHIPFSGIWDPAEQQRCQKYVDALPPTTPVTIAPGTSLAAVTKLTTENLSKGLRLSGDSSVLLWGHSGTAFGTVDVGEFTGKFEVFGTNIALRKINVTIAGHKMLVPNDPSAGTRATYLGDVNLPTGGSTEVRIDIGGTNLNAGTSKKTANGSWFGSVTLIPKGDLFPKLVTLPAKDMKCPGSVDWLETPAPVQATNPDGTPATTPKSTVTGTPTLTAGPSTPTPAS